jgi:hypothetical protein
VCAYRIRTPFILLCLTTRFRHHLLHLALFFTSRFFNLPHILLRTTRHPFIILPIIVLARPHPQPHARVCLAANSPRPHHAGLRDSFVRGPIKISIGSCHVTVNTDKGPWNTAGGEGDGADGDTVLSEDWNNKLPVFEKLVLINTAQPHRFAEATEQVSR